MEEDNDLSGVSCLSPFEDLDKILEKEGLQWGETSKVWAIYECLKRLGSYVAQKVIKKLVQQGEFEWDYEKEFEVEAILDYAKEDTDEGNEIELYLIKWKGWTHTHNTWEPKAHLDCPNLLDAFHKLHAAEASRSQIVAKMNEITKSDEATNFLDKIGEMSRKMATNNILPHKLMQVAKLVSKRRIEQISTQQSKRQKTNEGKVNITNKKTKAYRVLKTEMELALKDWERQINKVDLNQAPVTVENKIDLDGPPDNFIYTNDYLAGEGVNIPQDPLVGCEHDNCLDEKKSCCGANAGSEFAYYKNKRVRVRAGTPIYECNSLCKCPKNCPNRVVQLGRQHKVCLFKTANGRGWGVRAMQKIKKGSFVVEYVGEVITHEEAERRGKEYDGAGRTYLFDLDYDYDDADNCPYTVDAGRYGNISHFINHSCDPNLIVYGVWINTLDPRLPRIALFAQRDIQKGEELTFDYMMTGDTTGGFSVRQEAARENEEEGDELSDATSEKSSEWTELDTKMDTMEKEMGSREDAQKVVLSEGNLMGPPSVGAIQNCISVNSNQNETASPEAPATEMMPMAAILSALDVKAKLSSAEEMPPTPPPSEIQETSPQLKRLQEIAPATKYRVVCQCGAKNCRGFLY